MVYYFTSRDGHVIYVGKNKFENEDLIMYGWNEDVWFHADEYSSAHVYLRLKDGENWLEIPQEALEDCCQLTKQGSIDGSKQDTINIVYTPWKNLKKTPNMDVGAIGYHKESDRKIIKDVAKIADILRVVSKTKVEDEFPQLEEKKSIRVQELQKLKLEYQKEQKKEQIQQQQIAKETSDLKSYKEFFKTDNYQSNKDEEDDDFM